MGKVRQILVTGATGFLGQEIVAEARRLDIDVAVLIRSESSIPAAWNRDRGIKPCLIDEKSPKAVSDIALMTRNSDAIIHAAGISADNRDGGDNAATGLTEALIQAITASKVASARMPRLILVSSLAVYGYTALPNDACLDEHTSIEPDLIHRDDYCRGKLAQERLVMKAAQADGLEARLIRVGTVYGHGRRWSARLGFKIAGWVICPNGQSLVPAIHVAHCARALVQSAVMSIGPNDVPILNGGGGLDIINLVDRDQPTQEVWLRTIGCTQVIRVPLAVLLYFARGLSLAGLLVPALGKWLPTGLREPTLAARFKPLHYSIARAEDRLLHRWTLSFVDAMSDSQIDKTTMGKVS